MQKLYSQTTLRTIINNINMGLVDFGESIENLHIVYDSPTPHPRHKLKKFLIKPVEIDIKSAVKKIVASSPIRQVEVNVYTFIVFTTIIDSDTNQQMLLATALDELLAMGVNDEEISFELDIPQWALIMI